MDGYDFKPKPPRAVTDFLKNKGLKPAFSWLDVYPEEHAFDFTVSKATQINVLTDIREEIQRALDEGLPYSEFQKRLKPRLKARGWWGTKTLVDPKTGKKVKARLGSPRRLRTIYWANVRTARAAGQWERIQNNKDMSPYIIYKLGPSENHRPLHADKAGIILPVDDPFWREWFAPNGWGCKCSHRTVSVDEAKKLGYRGKPAPKIPRDKHINKRTGQVTDVPRGIDPGWHTNPGLSRRKNIKMFLSEALEKAPPDLARIAISDLVRDDEFKAHILGERLSTYPVAIVPENDAKYLKSKSRTVLLSQQTAKHHSINKTPKKYVKPEHWVRIQENIEIAKRYADPKNSSIIIYIITAKDGEKYRLVVKTTNDQSELYVKTFYRLGLNPVKKFRGDQHPLKFNEE
ncbi:MAG: phage minor head protein [Robiginitomaculum sp.]